MRAHLALSMALALAACGGSTSAPPASAPVQATPPPPRVAAVVEVSGVDGVIGATADVLVTRFGPPRIDLAEGDARKLQFSGEPCVLDIYLYTLQSGGVQQATYIDARRADGQSVDIEACVRALSGR